MNTVEIAPRIPNTMKKLVRKTVTIMVYRP